MVALYSVTRANPMVLVTNAAAGYIERREMALGAISRLPDIASIKVNFQQENFLVAPCSKFEYNLRLGTC